MDLQTARDEACRLLLAGRLDEAEAAYREVLAAYPDCPEAHNELGLALLEKSAPDCAAAATEFAAAEALWSATGSLARATALTNWGRALLQLARYDEAADRFAAADQAYESDDPESADRKFPLRYWGELLRLQDRYAESEVRCRAAFAADHTDPVSANTLGIVLEAQGPLRATDAIEAYTQACVLYAAHDPANPDRKFPIRNWGDVLQAQGRFAEAEARYREALEVDPIDPITHNSLGVSLEAQGPGRHAEALEQYCHANDLYVAGDPENPARKLPLWNCGDILRMQGHWSEAEARYREALSIDPPSAALTNLLGLAVHGQGVARFAEAIGHYRDADAAYAANDREDPNRKYPLRNWGDVLRSQGRFADAEAKFREALALDLRDPLTRNALGGALEAQGPARYDEAIEQYRESAALLTDDAHAVSARAYPLRRWGNLLHAQGHLQAAEERFRAARAADPDDPAPANSLGVVLEAQGAPRHAEAITAYCDAIALYAAHDSANPDRRVPLRNWGDVLRADGRFSDAETKYREALEIDPTDPVTHSSLGAALQAQGQTRFADAIDHYRASVAAYEEADPADPDRKYPLRKWADVLSAQGRLAEAEERLRAARAADPADPTIVNALGVALETQGAARRTEAIETYRDAFALYLAHDPANANRKFPLRNWGDVLRAQGHTADAEARYREALAADPADPATHNSLGAVLEAQGRDRYAEAIEHYRESAQLYARDDSTTTNRRYPLRNWGDVLRLQGHWAEAETKYREALAADPDDAGTMNSLGIALQGRGPEYYATFDASAARFAAVGSVDAIYPLHNASWLLGEMEDFDAALQKQRTALATKPDSAEEHYLLANTLANASQYREALDAFERAIQLDANDPFPRHNKAHYLFYLGRYADGWKAWDDARGAYSRSFRAGLPEPVDVERAQHHASVLATVYYERDEAERLFRMVADKDPSQAETLAGLATLYYQWANSEKPSASAQATLSAAIRKAASALRERVGKDDGWKSSLDLADLYIEVEDFGAAEEWLVRAEAACGELRVRRGRVASRFGILHAKRERYDKAVDKLQEALRVFPEDVKVRANLAEAYLKLHQLDRAESEFRRVAALAPGNIEALIGSAQLCIELADDGDMDRCTQAEKFLSDAIQHGEHSSSGSKRLTGKELAEVYYLRGYVRAKRYEADSGRPLLLPAAERDFRTCLKLDSANFKAESAVQKLRARRRSLQRGTLFEWLGPIVVGFAATCVFVLTQLDFFFGGQEVFGVRIHATRKLDQPGFYVLTTFGSLVFMVASLYLPKVLKLKVGAIELEKSTVEQISTPVSLGIGR